MNAGAMVLDGVRVIEIGEGRSAPLAARLLGDLGAEVTKIEQDVGDSTRAVGPYFMTDEGDERSALFEYLNWNKKSARLDPEADAEVLMQLVATADVVIIGDDVCMLELWGLDPLQLHEQHSQLVIVTVTPFGTSGPRAHWVTTDLIMQAASGIMSFSGSSDREPLRRGLFQSTYESAFTVAYVALAALLVVRDGDGGAFIDVSMTECLSSELVLTIPEYVFAGLASGRRPPVLDPLVTGEPLPAGDGFVTLQLNPQIPVSAFVDVIGDDRLADTRFATAESRAALAHELVDVFRAALVDRSPSELFVEACTRGLLAGFVQDAEHLLCCPQLDSRDVYVAMPGTLGGKPWRMPIVRAVSRPAIRPAPRLGEHSPSFRQRQEPSVA